MDQGQNTMLSMFRLWAMRVPLAMFASDSSTAITSTSSRY